LLHSLWQLPIEVFIWGIELFISIWFLNLYWFPLSYSALFLFICLFEISLRSVSYSYPLWAPSLTCTSSLWTHWSFPPFYYCLSP
jgi:hypothetical protein